MSVVRLTTCASAAGHQAGGALAYVPLVAIGVSARAEPGTVRPVGCMRGLGGEPRAMSVVRNQP